MKISTLPAILSITVSVYRDLIAAHDELMYIPDGYYLTVRLVCPGYCMAKGKNDQIFTFRVGKYGQNDVQYTGQRKKL